MGDSRAAGAFVGHIEGLTFIDSKGDGRKYIYLLRSALLTPHRVYSQQWQRSKHEAVGSPDGNAIRRFRKNQASQTSYKRATFRLSLGCV
jgi:hypothetical protein